MAGSGIKFALSSLSSYASKTPFCCSEVSDAQRELSGFMDVLNAL